MLRMHVGVGTTVGAVTVFPVWTEAAEPGIDYMAFGEAEDAGWFALGEAAQPTVPSLHAVNEGGMPVLLLAGELVTGGQQDRVLNTTVMVAAHAHTPIPVSCVERGRWSGGTRSRRLGHAPPRLRARATSASAKAADRRADQGEVWREVAGYLACHQQQSPTGALRAAAADAVPVAAFPLLEGQRGVVIGIGGRVRSLEVFDRHATLRGCFDDLVAAAVLEGHGMPAAATPGRSARRFVRKTGGASWSRRPAVALGEEHVVTGESIVGAALRWQDRIVHLATFSGAGT